MFQAKIETRMDGRCFCHAVQRGSEALTYAEVLELWQESGSFRSFFIGLLADNPFTAYRWETPAVTRSTIGRPFEFVLVDSAWLARAVDARTFEQYFKFEGDGVEAFENLGGDAMMVVPSPRGPENAYGHLASFIREAPEAQVHALWRTVGAAVQQRLSERSLWLSTAGGGVSWLHVRLDSRPKYYSYAPYKEPA